MQDAGYAALQIIPSFDGFQGHLERGSSGALIAAGRTGGHRFGDSAGRSAGARFGSVFKSTIAALGLFQLGRYGLDFLGDSVAEARESQKVGALTAQVIKTTGQAANVTAKEVGDLSTALSLKTGVDDEVIQRGANMLLTFKNIRNEVGKNNDIFDQSVAITEDMAAAMAGGQGGNNLDLKSSSILVGKALNDPAKGLTALTRVGVTFTEQQKKTIESLLEQNKVSSAQKVILGELKSEFGGAAQAQATMGEKVSVAWGNIQEKVGTALLPLIRDVQRAFLREGVPALNRFSDWFQDEGVDSIRNFIRETKPLAREVLPAAADALGTVRDVAKEALPYAKDLVGAFNDLPDWAKKGAVVGGLGAFAGSKLGLGSLLTGGRGAAGGGGLLGGITKSAPLPVYVVNSLPGGAGLPGVIGGGAGTRTTPVVGNLPKYAPLVPIGYGSAPGQQSLIDQLMNGKRQDAPGTITTERGTFKVLTEEQSKALAQQQADYERWFNTMIKGNHEITESTKDLIAGTGRFGMEIKGLPRELVTKFVAPGLVENRKDANALVKQYDLTPKQKNTLFRVLGIPQAKNSTNELIDILVNAAKPRAGRVTVDTSDAQARADRLLATLNNINRLAALHAAGVGPAAPSAPRTKAPRRITRERPAQVFVDGQQFTGRIREEIDTHDDLADERRRAGALR